MRIIDSNKDYYDFYQNIYRDNMLTFDRRDSYDLSKKEFAANFREKKYYSKHRYHYVDDKNRLLLLQVGYNFWLIRLIMTKNDSYGECLDYTLALLSHWKDYTEKKLIELSLIRINNFSMFYSYSDAEFKRCIEAARAHDYEIEKCFNSFRLARDADFEKRTIPILKNIGIPAIIPALDIYLAFEEYFATKKSDREVTASVDLTNDDKITNHGFDLKTSFRGSHGKNV